MRNPGDNRDAIADLLSLISHDIKNGLNVINLGAHQLGSLKGVDPETAARLRKIAEMLTRSSRRMTDLMRDVVDLSRIEADNFEVELKPVSLERAIEHAIADLKREIEDGMVSVEVSAVPALEVAGDQERVGNVVTVLLSNAVRVSSPGGRVRISTDSADGRARLEVRDEGPGIEPELIAGLFERPRPKRGDKRSLGRGLPLARGVITGLGGTLDVQSEPGKGSTFSFTLPLATR